jgi:hypothetical protein
VLSPGINRRLHPSRAPDGSDHPVLADERRNRMAALSQVLWVESPSRPLVQAFRRLAGYDPEIHPHRNDIGRRGVQHSMSRRLLCGVLTLAAVTAIGERSAYARQCGRIVPTCQAYWESQTVFVGTVRKVTEAAGVRRLTFDVEQSERGAGAPTVTVRIPTWELVSRSPLRVGDRYVVYAHGAGDEMFIGACGRTRLASEAEEDLAYFREMKAPGSGGRIFGSVRHEEPDFVQHGARDLGPIVGLTIRLQGRGLDREVSTAKNGAFQFDGLLPGEYTVSLRAPERMLLDARMSGVYSTPAPGSFTVNLRYARGCMPISFAVREPGSIRGVLLDDRGAPFEGELVSAIAAVNAGGSEHLPVERVRTGADGRFEFTPLPRGQYVLVLNLDDRAEWTEFNRRVYHPGTRVPGEATLINVDGPTTVDVGVFRVPPDPVERTINGVVVWSDGVPAWDAALVLHGAAPERVPLDGDGRFRVTLPYGARFTLRAQGRRQVRGRMRESPDESTAIGRNDRDRDVRLVLRVPE